MLLCLDLFHCIIHNTCDPFVHVCLCVCVREIEYVFSFLSVLHACAHMSLCVFLHHVCCKSRDPLGTVLGVWLLKIVVLFLVQTLLDLVAHTKHHLLSLILLHARLACFFMSGSHCLK